LPLPALFRFIQQSIWGECPLLPDRNLVWQPDDSIPGIESPCLVEEIEFMTSPLWRGIACFLCKRRLNSSRRWSRYPKESDGFDRIMWAILVKKVAVLSSILHIYWD
jgi:hypothetical protein